MATFTNDSGLEHRPDLVRCNGETWSIICACSWETWGVEDEEEAWEAFKDHVFDDVNTALLRFRNEARVLR